MFCCAPTQCEATSLLHWYKHWSRVMNCSLPIHMWGTSGKCWSTETEVRRKAAYQCLVPYWLMTVPRSQRMTVSKRYESWAITHRTHVSTTTHLAWHGECSLVVVLFPDYLLVSLSSFIAGWAIGEHSQQETTTTVASASVSREPRSIQPKWLGHSLLVLVWVWLTHV